MPRSNATSNRAGRTGIRARLARLASADWGAIASSAAVAATVTILVALTVAVALGYPYLEARAAQVRSTPVRAIFSWPPLAGSPGGVTPDGQPATWMNSAIRSRLESLVTEQVSADPFDRASLERARDLLHGTGWFDAPPVLERGADGSVRVAGVWRIPAAVVRHAGRDRLVATGGELLEPVYREGTSGLKVIVGVGFDPPAVGAPWLGGDVQAALALLTFVQRSAGFAQVAGVDVTGYDPDRRLALITDRGTRVIWGSPPNEWNPGEPSSETKLQHLDLLASRDEFGRRIDACRPQVDLSNPRGVLIDSTAGTVPPAAGTKAGPPEPPARR